MEQTQLNIDMINQMFLNSSISLEYSDSRCFQKKQDHPQIPEQQRQQSLEIMEVAARELSKVRVVAMQFNLWIAETETSQSANYESLNQLIEEIETGVGEAVGVDELMLIKEELFRREQQDQRAENCQECCEKGKKIQEMQKLHEHTINEKSIELKEFKEQMLIQAVMQTKEYLLEGVENNLLKSEIRDLNNEINALKNEKITLERTFLFNKTRNSEITNLQKSKDLSAAKNSTNSSELLTRNHETIVFIDPIESDVEEWIKFFETQKNRYRILSKKQAEERQKELGRAFNKQERQGFESEDKVCVLFNSIKEILRNLMRIRENTSSFQQTDSMGKSALREKTMKNSDQDLLSLKQQFQKLQARFNKLVKINEYLVREKQNLEEINWSLKQQRLKENNERNMLSEALKKESLKISELEKLIKEYEESVARLKNILVEKQEELLFFFEEVKMMKKMYPNLTEKYKLLEKRYKEIEIENMSLALRLKRQVIEKKKINESQDLEEPSKARRSISRKNI